MVQRPEVRMKRDCCHLVLKELGLVFFSSGQSYSLGREKNQEIALDGLKIDIILKENSAWATHCFRKSKSIERYFLSKAFLV